MSMVEKENAAGRERDRERERERKRKRKRDDSYDKNRSLFSEPNQTGLLFQKRGASLY